MRVLQRSIISCEGGSLPRSAITVAKPAIAAIVTTESDLLMIFTEVG
jgi:hypothetical protein